MKGSLRAVASWLGLLLAGALVVACGEAAAPTTPGAASPVAGAGCQPVELRGPDGRQIDLSGTWSGNDGGRYYLKQIDSCVWWSGLSAFEGQSLGEEWIMAFRGRLDDEGVIVGDFVDVKGTNPGSGTMSIRVQAEQRDGRVVVELYREAVTGHQIGVTFWERTAGDVPPTPATSPSPADGGPTDDASPTGDAGDTTPPANTPPAVTLPPS